MVQAAPTVLLYAQALALISELNTAFAAGLVDTKNELTERLVSIISQYEATAGYPLYQFDPIVEDEPPLSAKINLSWEALRHDIAIMQQQLDILRASSIATFNYIAVETQKALGENARLSNKTKVLQLYSDSTDSSVITFADTFSSGDFIDSAAVNVSSRAQILNNTFLSLGLQGQRKNLLSGADIKILESSNGFIGNNQEIQDPSRALINPISREPIYTFVAESLASPSMKTIIDEAPDTFFEYENYLVQEADRVKADNLNFVYGKNVTEQGQAEYVDWAVGPSDGVLKLSLELDLKSVQDVNYISYIPYGLPDNKNNPVKVHLVETSDNGTDWEAVNPKDVWVSPELNLRTARIASDAGQMATWTFEKRTARYVRIHFLQPNPIEVPVGHVYYISANDNSPYPKRVLGPIPPVTNPTRYYDPNSYALTDKIQKREYFNGKRWAIGIRDIAVEQIQFVETSEIVTKPLRVGGIVDRVVLEAEVFIPKEFDSNVDWVQFFISPDEGTSWFKISRIQDDYLLTPEILAFNDPTPDEFHDPNVTYFSVPNAVESLKLKIVLMRPGDMPNATPLVRSYKLKVRKRI